MPTAQVKCRNIGLTGAGRAGLLRAVVVLAAALGGAVAGGPAYAATGTDPTLTGSTSGSPNQNLAMIFRWQKPSHTATESCGGPVGFTFDSWPLRSVDPTDQGLTCAASYFGPPPLLDRAPGRHTVRAAPDAAGVPARSATYTIVATARSASPTGRASSTAQSSPTAGAGPTKTARARTAPGSAGSPAPAPTVMPSDPGAAASPAASTAPTVLVGGPGSVSPGGGGALAWLLVLLGVLGLAATAALTAVVVRRSRQVEVEDL